jgi:DNA-binding CsgD family transcriptional regulator
MREKQSLRRGRRSMADIRQINEWRMPTSHNGLYERMLGAVGSEEFGATVRDSITSAIGGVRRMYLFEATSRDDTSLQYYYGEPGLVDVFPAYLKWYLRLDPVSDAYQAAPRVSNVALQRVRPMHIASAGFRRRVFDDAGIVERVSVIQRGPDAWRVINVARHANDGLFSDGEINLLVSMACLALPMLPLSRNQQECRPQLSVEQAEERFARRFPELTLRERQVCARAAVGMSVEATALALQVAKTSILTYRRRAYERLRVSSPYELCALVSH